MILTVLGHGSRTALLNSVVSRKSKRMLTTSFSSSRVYSYSPDPSLTNATQLESTEGLIRVDRQPKNLCAAKELITPYPNIVRIIHLELGPSRHLKWHLNMTNGKICLLLQAPSLYKLLVPGVHSRIFLRLCCWVKDPLLWTPWSVAFLLFTLNVSSLLVAIFCLYLAFSLFHFWSCW